MPIATIYMVSGLLFLGAAHDLLPYLPYGYFTFLSIVVTGTFILAFIISFNRNGAWLPWIFLSFAVAFNPILKIPLPHELWMIVDVAAGAILVLTQNKIKQQSSVKVI